ncbi:gliding motility-associated C-terminal domain-containing protein [Flavobacterium sp. '19STA2R22 D10 B1']|uniref:T9SS type B sorting domain-containing protein n=1 Tax=Flavobacterium aerium TaxID=3037261 RepID=UPI00278C6769|nr:gliding motility-associated C-terminal domain-containing protein [Flavobacterium sp. '19STA2R22 D10 B1']
MKLKTQLKQIIFLILFSLLSYQQAFSQCFEIESILVDACGADEGLNEMVRFKVGNANINTNDLVVSWPNNSWKGLIKNAVTAAKVTQLNADIVAAGGCGQLLEPTGGVLPANARVILVTSYNMDTALNSFGALTETIYIIFQNNPNTVSGHFANFGAGVRTLTMLFNSCVDTVTYNRALLVDTNGTPGAADGSTVLFTSAGVASYINNGCAAPVPPFTVDAGPQTMTACAGATINLNGSAQGQQSVLWSAPSGTFSTASALSTTYTISPTATGTIVLTLTATNSCGATKTDTINVTVSNSVTPNFATALTLCNGATAPALATTSPNGITGTWNPATINNTTSGSYVFTPNAGQCAVPVTLNVTVGNSITPNFATTLTLCNGATAPALATTSPNGITGTWSPATINNTTSGNYVFTPNAGQCATSVTLAVTVTNSITPNFATTLTLCNGATAPVLAATSPNGITGTWSPATINNTTSGNYVFTPNAGQCATAVTLAVTITNSITPNFATTLALCSNATAPTLATTSPNGITGTWNPAVISNTTSGNYVFTPNAGQCATAVTLVVTVANSITPNFATTLALCNGATAPALATTSPNGITGTWNPAVISNTTSGSYVFTPNAGQCAVSVTLNVTISNSITPNFATTLTLCNGAAAPALATTSPNGITGTWNPAVINTTTGGNYVFTPNAGQCATAMTLVVTISNSITPNFATALTLCSSAIAPTLALTSPNGIAGTWSPATISTTTSGNYVFTPNAGQCATSTTLVVTITNSITPNFVTTLTLCNGATAPALATTSPNGITGTWSPAVVNNTTSGNYIFTPNTGQCATTFTFAVTVTKIDFTLNDNCVNGDYVIEATPNASSYNSNDVDYVWKNSQGNVVGSNDATLNVTDVLSSSSVTPVFPMTFTLTITTSQGCTETKNVEVLSTFCSIQKGISPNNDGKNDFFDLVGLNVKHLTIFNRYGTKVYSYSNYSNQWYGQSDKGNDLPTATYYYVIELDGQPSKTGWIYINRERN